MSALAIPRFSPEQYLEGERAAELKSEYIDGEIVAMSGGTLLHAVISASLIRAIGSGLRPGQCKVATSDLRVRVSARGPYFYPDATVFCGAPELADDYKDILVNPTVVFEVLSQSSEAYDRGLKFAKYRNIASLREYVLVSQSEPLIEVFTRQAQGKWLLSEFAGIDSVCRLESIECDIPLSAIYDQQAA